MASASPRRSAHGLSRSGKAKKLVFRHVTAKAAARKNGRAFKFVVYAANPPAKRYRTVGAARRGSWTLADALQWSEQLAREETSAQRAESRRVWAALVRAGLA